MSLADAINVWSYQHKCQGIGITDAAYQVQVKYRTKLRVAERFVLSDDSVRLICHLAHQTNRLEGWSFLARLPFSPIFFELDLHVKVREFEKMGSLRHPFDPSLVSPRIGYLMWRDTTNDENPRWVCHGFSELDGGAIPEMISYVFDPEGNPMFPTRGSDYWQAPTMSLIPGFPKVPIRAYHQEKEIDSQVDPELILGGVLDPGDRPASAKVIGLKYVVDEGLVKGPSWLIHRMAVILDPWWNLHIDNDPRKFKLVLNQIMENAGHLRWIITMLAAINGIPKSIRPLPVRTDRRTLGMHRLKYFTSSVVELTIPAEDKLAYARSKLNKASSNVHRPWHKVRGHWRVVEYGKAQYFCRHDPVMVEHGLGICTKCELLVRWINDFVQGTPEEGIHQHDHYEVKT